MSCASCGAAADHWAYDHTDPNERRDDRGRPYSTDLDRYRPLCKTCHRRFDVQHMPVILCTSPGCTRPQKAKALCNAHYQAARTSDTAL